MININCFKNKKIAIVGLARSGLACANLLYGLGAKINITDNQDNAVTRANSQKLKSTIRLPSGLMVSEVEPSPEIKFELGKHTKEFIQDRDIVVISPGVSGSALPIVWARQLNIPVISEIEVAGILCPAPIIAVTGSNGKTTVTTLIGKVLAQSKRNVFVCGNIGNPFCGELEKIKAGDFVSLEVSSFQLETIEKFKPKISVILNFSRNHLDRYANMQEYLEAKKRIFMNQDKNDWLVLNNDCPALRELAKESKAGIKYFSATGEFNPVRSNSVERGASFVTETSNGVNPNQAAVLTVASILGIDKEICFKVFEEFKGIEHRLEYVTEINNIKFINDSKSTTVESALWALKNTPSPIILIAGGREKGNDYTAISDLVREKVKEVILIGEAREKIGDALKKILSINEASSLEEAVRLAFDKAVPGDCVLFSPMCKSFDMFSNYEERGRIFKECVFARR